MPYIACDKRDAVVKGLIGDPGDLNYFLTTVLLRAWKQQPRYTTIHCFKRDFVIDPKNNPFLQDLRSQLADRFKTADIYAAAACAYDEFYRRVGSKYEKRKIKENGDLPEYVEAVQEIEAEVKELPLPTEEKSNA